MKPVLIAGTIIVNFALISYAIGVITEQRRHKTTKLVLTFLTVGVILDIVATILMILGSSRGPFTLHGIFGFSSLAGMLLETILAWRHRLTRGEAEVPRGLHLYTRVAFGWWIAAYVTGAILVAYMR